VLSSFSSSCGRVLAPVDRPVDDWTAYAPLTSHGRSGVGFVNFGTITTQASRRRSTRTVSARGFNVYRLVDFAGPTVDTVEFDEITTHADAAIGSRSASRSGD
jgi:hypothetical protein